MLVEKHAFKTFFAVGAATGYVVCAQRAATAGHAAKPEFVEIPGEKNTYRIFEDRAFAEQELARVQADFPPNADLTIRAVTVEAVRDYQRLAGYKLVHLVDRSGQAAASLRLGEMPLAARTHSPFFDPLPAGLRITDVPAATKPEPIPVVVPAPAAVAPIETKPRRKPGPLPVSDQTTTDPFFDEPIDHGQDPATVRRRTPSVRPGVFARLLRRLFLGKT